MTQYALSHQLRSPNDTHTRARTHTHYYTHYYQLVPDGGQVVRLSLAQIGQLERALRSSTNPEQTLRELGLRPIDEPEADGVGGWCMMYPCACMCVCICVCM
jgi:hypothetical protein